MAPAQVSADLNVIVTAYCPLNDWPSKLKAVDDQHVAAIAKRLGKTSAQVILRWGVQLGWTLLTRSSKPERLHEATQLWDFELSDGDMALLSGLAWFVLTPSNAVPATVVDAYGVAERDAAASKQAPRGKPPVAQPIKACDLAWSMLGTRSNNERVEL